MICTWWPAIILSFISALIILCTNKIMIKKQSQNNKDDNVFQFAIKIKEVFIISLFSIFESVAVYLIFIE